MPNAAAPDALAQQAASPDTTAASGSAFNLLPSFQNDAGEDDYALPIQLLLLLTVLSLAPAIIVLMTK